jgi:Salmonella virulence plasmid 65kDa B protein
MKRHKNCWANLKKLAVLSLAIGFASGVSAQIATQFTHDASGGSASVTVPIAVPPGTAGMVPTLAFNYSSTGGGSFMGQGWSISGSGSISRCPMNLATEQRVLGANGDMYSGALCLNGQKLIQLDQSAPYGSVNAGVTKVEFRTEIESYSRIVAFIVDPLGFSSGKINRPWNKVVGWRVWTKSGLIMEYGEPDAAVFQLNGANSRVDAVLDGGSGASQSWMLARVFDTAQNYMEYTYTEDSQMLEAKRPASIQYGGNLRAGVAHHSRVDFVWDPAPEGQAAPRGFNSAGSPVTSSFVLRGVTTKTKQFALDTLQFAKRYRVNYLPNSATSIAQVGYKRVVSSIEECGTEDCTGSSVIPASFVYSSALPSFAANGGGLASEKRQLFTSPFKKSSDPLNYVDVNNDGLLDACWVIGNIIQCSMGTKELVAGANANFIGFSENIVTSTMVLSTGFPTATMLDGTQIVVGGVQFFGFMDVNGDANVDACWVAVGGPIVEGVNNNNLNFPLRCMAGQSNGTFTGWLKPLGTFDDKWF